MELGNPEGLMRNTPGSPQRHRHCEFPARRRLNRKWPTLLLRGQFIEDGETAFMPRCLFARVNIDLNVVRLTAGVCRRPRGRPRAVRIAGLDEIREIALHDVGYFAIVGSPGVD